MHDRYPVIRWFALVTWLALCAPSLQARTFCVQHQGQTVGSLVTASVVNGAVRTEREHWRLHVRGARHEGDVQIQTEVRRGPDGLRSAARTYQAGDVLERSDARWHDGQWQLRFQQGARVEQQQSARPTERQALPMPAAGERARQFDALNFELLDLQFDQGRWTDAEQLRTFLDAADGLTPQSAFVLGLHLAMVDCRDEEANRRRHALDLDAASGLELPTVLSDDSRDGKLGFELLNVPEALLLPELSTQTARRQGQRLAVVVCARCALQDALEPVPGPALIAANAFVDSDHPAIQAQAKVLRAETDLTTMQRSVRFVRKHLWQQTDTLGYASASQALLSAQGNCSEHALLLAALARANGIPTRVIHGLVYHPNRRHQAAALLPHLWVQAWIDGRWQHFDAGQKNYSAAHIALAISDGDPAPVNASLTLILDAKVQRVVALR